MKRETKKKLCKVGEVVSIAGEVVSIFAMDTFLKKKMGDQKNDPKNVLIRSGFNTLAGSVFLGLYGLCCYKQCDYELEEFSESLTNNLNESLNSANNIIKNASKINADYASSIAKSVSDTFDEMYNESIEKHFSDNPENE